ncbi:MAG: acyltransferase [Clostridiales bacterium]|jgi:acetyltransferase-like isoleucine patch superfamily enzyme|nr:acyltransferase [Clostridiales bacterium]
MDNYYSSAELEALGIKKIGTNVKVSRKASLHGCDRMEFGDNVRVDDFCFLYGKLVFGSYIHIAPFCFLSGGDEGIYFGDFSGLSFRVSAFTRSDDYSGGTLTNPMVPEKYRYKTVKKELYIKKHAIVGVGSIIMPGAHIEEGVAVGAASLVTKPTEPWGIYTGIPAVRRERERERDAATREGISGRNRTRDAINTGCRPRGERHAA